MKQFILLSNVSTKSHCIHNEQNQNINTSKKRLRITYENYKI